MTKNKRNHRKNKHLKRRAVIANLSNDRNITMIAAAHIYNCWPRCRQQHERSLIKLEDV